MSTFVGDRGSVQEPLFPMFLRMSLAPHSGHVPFDRDPAFPVSTPDYPTHSPAGQSLLNYSAGSQVEKGPFLFFSARAVGAHLVRRAVGAMSAVNLSIARSVSGSASIRKANVETGCSSPR